MFKRVAQELSKVENATQRTALQTELLGKAVKGTNWKDFVDNYKELGDPLLLKAIEENAKAWGNIEATFKELLNVVQKLVMPFALLVNHISDIRKEYERLQKGGGAEIDFGAAFGGMPGEAIVGTYYDAKPANAAKPISKEAKPGDYKTLSKKKEAEANKAAEEAKRKAEARAALQLEIDLIKQKADIADKMFAIDAKGIVLGDKAISQEKMMLDLANDIAEIRNAAAKERGKDKAQVDLINAKETAAIDARVRKFGIENALRQQRVQREHQLTMENIQIEYDKRSTVNNAEYASEASLIALEKQRYELGENAYEIKKLEVEANNDLAKASAEHAMHLADIQRTYELSGKSAEDAAERDKNNQLASIAYEEQKNKIVAIQQARTEVLIQQQTRQHEINIRNIKDQTLSRELGLKLQTTNEKELLSLERERFELGSSAYALKKIEIDASQQIKKVQFDTAEKTKEINKVYEQSGKTVKDLELKEANILSILIDEMTQIGAIVELQKLRTSVTQEQFALEDKMFTLDIAQQKGRDIANIAANLNVEKQRLDLENNRYLLSTNQYNLSMLALENIQRLAEAEKKYNDQMKDAEYELQRQGGGQRARERYEQRIKSIEEVRDIELLAIEQVNQARQQNLEKEIERQRSFVSGWEYAARRFQEDAEMAFNRGAASFQSVMSNMEAAIGNFVETGKFSFEDFAISVVKDLIRIELQAQASYFFRMLLSSFAPTPAAATTPVNAGVGFQTRATGGDIDGPAIVGENGPELFIPSQRGTIIPNTIAPSMAGMQQPQVVYNGPYIENMSAIDTQSAAQFLSKNKMSVWAANKSADRSVPVSR